MAELNSTDHLVRHDKDTVVNGYDNEAYHPQTEEGDESASDDDHLRAVVTENGQAPTPLSNGTPLNGHAVVAEDTTPSSMDDTDSRRPLDTRLHHYVPVEDIDKKILNGSETHVSIPDDAVISLSSGRVRVKKSASNSPRLDNNRESIPLEDMHPPSYNDGQDDDDKSKEKADLEAELSNHKNGVWSSGDAYGSAESHFISEKLNGKSKSSGGDEAAKLPVNNHRKCLSRESSLSTCSSEHKPPTGEKLYFTEDSRKICPNLKRGVICGIIVVVISVVLLLCVLAATGIILSKSESARYESGHSLPSMDSISHAGHSFRPKVPHKAIDTVSQTPPPTVTTKVPLADESHSHTTVPNALVGEFTILDENFTDDLNDNTSQGYMNLARNLETELRRIFKENGGRFDTLKILNFRPGSIKVKFVIIWSSDKGIVLSDKATEILSEDLRQKNNSFYNFFPVDIGSIHFIDVFDECRIKKGGCSFDCLWNYDTLSKTCICQPQMHLLPDGKTCASIPDTGSTTTTASSENKESVPTLQTFTTLETTIFQTDRSQGNISFLVPFPDVFATKETVTTQASIDESTTVEGRSMDMNLEHTYPVDTHHTYLETTTSQQSDIMNAETSPTSVNYFTEQGASDSNTTPSTDTATENPFFESSTETSSFSNIPSTKDHHTDSTPIAKETTTVALQNLTSESHEIVLNTEAATQAEPELPITTTETEETATTGPSLARTDEGTTLKFHVVQPTTEVYTFNSELDFTDQYPDSTVASVTLSDQNETTSTESTHKTDEHVTFNEHFPTQPEILPDVSNVTDSQPTTTIEPPRTSTDVNNGTTLELIDFTTPQPLTNIQTTPSSDELDNGTFSTTEDSEIEHETVPPMTLNWNETEYEITTENPEVLTTTSNITPYSNRTSGVRYIDNFTDLYENITDNRFLITDAISTDSATEKTTFLGESPVNGSNSDITTSIPMTETIPGQFTDTVLEAKPTEKAPFWIKKIDDTIDYTTENYKLNTTEPVAETVTMYPTTLNNFTFPTEIFTNDSFPAEDEVYLEHANDTLTLPPKIEEPETTTLNLDAETVTTNTFSSFPEIAATTPEIPISNNTENNITLAFDETVEATTLLFNTQETANNDMTESTNPTVTMTSHTPSENASVMSTVEYSNSGFINASTNPSLLEDNTTTPTALIDMGNAFTSTVSSLEIDTQTTQENVTMPVETTNTDVLLTETTNPTTILDSEIETSTLSTERVFLPTSKSVEVAEVFTESILQTTNVETTDLFANESNSQTLPPMVTFTETMGANNESETEFSLNTTEFYETTFDTEVKPVTDLDNGTVSIANHTFGMDTNETTYTEASFISNITEEVTTLQSETTLVDGNIPEETSTAPYVETTTSMPSLETEHLLTSDMNTTDVNLVMSNATSDNSTDFLDTEEGTTYAPYMTENSTTVESNDTETHYNWKKQEDNLTNEFGVLSDSFNATDGNYSFDDEYGNYTSTGFEGLLNETTTNASVGIVCRDDQFICEPLNLCLNYTFMCDGIQDCPDGVDEFSCQDSCGSNFRCSNFSNMCIMSQAHCDGIWDCENGTDEENCSPTECAKHEVMCLDKSKCIRPSDICDLKYDCKDRSDEVGCVERTTCESGGKFFCNDGLCIPWSLKCDGEFDCKDKEDEGNCTCLNDEFQCNDGKCLKSSSRCDGHKDCHDADDEMGCVNVDSQHIVTTYEPYSGTWALLCAEDFNLDDGHYLCQELGFGHALKTEKLHVSFNGTWMAMRRENLTDASLWTERVSFVESCTSSAAAVVECQKFACGEYSGLLHRRKRDVSSSSSTQWPFIGYTSTFSSNRGCMSEILTPIWLITSAECLLTISKEPFNGSDWYVRTNIGRGDDTGLAQNHEVLRIVSHPHSSKFRSLILRDYDVALVRLKHALVFVSDKIGAICPPEEQVPPGITCFSGVLGTQKPRAPPPTELTINSLALQIMERRNCNSIEHYDNQINTRMLCTQSSEGHTICDNDEGTPLMCLTGINKWFLAGMLTYQRYCEVYSKHPAVFSNLFAMRKFIDQVTGQKQYEISYDPNVYIIIPPTTPSPTVPETTTIMYTTTEAINTTYLTTDWGYTMAGMFNDSEADTTPAVEMSLSPMIEGENVTEIEGATTVGTVEVRGEEFNATGEDLETGGNFTEAGMESESNSTVLFEDTLGWNETSEVTPGYGGVVMVNFTLQPLLFAPGMNSTAMALVDDAATLKEQFGFENASDVEAEMYETNISAMSNKTHDSMVGLTTEMYLDNENATEMFEASTANSTVQVVEDAETTTVTMLEETESLFITENATDLGDLNSTMSNGQTLPSSNETLIIAPERLTLTTLQTDFDGETTTEAEINSTMNATELTDSTLKFENMPSHYNLSEVDGNETTVTNTLMKAARFESETIGLTEHPFLTNVTTSIYDLANTTEEYETLATGPTVLPLETKSNGSEVENMTIKAEVDRMETTDKSFLIKDDLPKTELEVEKMDSETTTISPDLKNTTDLVDDSNSTNSATEPETADYNTETPHLPEETITDSGLRPTTLTPDSGTYVFESEVGTDGDLSLILNGSHDFVVEPVTFLDAFGNLEEKNGTEAYLSRGRMLVDAGNSSILYDSAHHNNSSPNAATEDESDHYILVELGEGLENATSAFELADVLNMTKPGDKEKTAEIVTENPFVPDTAPYTETKHLMLNNSSNVTDKSEDYFLRMLNDEIRLENSTSLLELLTALNTTGSSERNGTTEIGIETVTDPVTPLIKNDSMLSLRFAAELTVLGPKNGSIDQRDSCGIWDPPSVTSEETQKPSYAVWPSLGYLQKNKERCPASLVSSRYVVTSVNCLLLRDSELDASKWFYTGGLYQNNSSTDEQQNFMAQEIATYPNSSLPTLFNSDNLAVVKLRKDVQLNKYSENVCLPQSETSSLQAECYTTGWSKKPSGKEVFFSIAVNVISQEMCNNSENYNGQLSENLICATLNSSLPTCEMISGAPLLCLNSDQRWEIQGILTTPNPCNESQPAVYYGIPSIREWISETITSLIEADW